MQRCPACGEENSDRARFCQNCATPLAGTGPAAEVRKVVTIVFADVTGSTALGERLDPEALRRVMGRYFDEMAAVIGRHGGTVEKFIGDAVMAVFGIPKLHEDDTLRAVRAAAEMRDALTALNGDLERDHGVGLEARIGVNTGEVVAGDPSAGQRLVTGDAVNVAARLEQAAEPGQILLGDPTYRLVRDAVEVASRASVEVKGKSEPVAAHRLMRLLEVSEGHARRLDSPMVGREKELELLERALDRAVTERTSHLFTLLGPAGVGKSRLVQEFLEGPGAAALVLSGRCLSYGDGITYFPLVEIVESAAAVERIDDLAGARSKLRALLDGADEPDRVAALVAGLLAWAEPVAAEDGYWGVRKLLEHLARDGPLVVVFDDVHWGEPAFLDLVEHVADWTRDARILLLCVARPELLEIRADWGGGKVNATTILLEPLPADEVSRLVDNLLGEVDIPIEARGSILEAAEGNPLFVEEMLGMLIDDGLLRLKDGRWHAAQDLTKITVPPTIQLLLAARLDRLDAEERAVIERGAVEGKLFHAGAVATLVPEALRPRVRPRLLALARKELIRADRAEFAGEDAFRFRHLLIRDAAYQAMPKEQRADLHERFAEWLERAAGGRVSEYEEILGYHLEQAYRYRSELGSSDARTAELGRSAADRLIASAERARERSDFSGSAGLLRSAIAVSDGTTRSRACFELAVTLIDDVDFRASAEAAERAIEAARAAGDRPHEVRSGLILAEATTQIDSTYGLAQSRAEAEAALAELQQLDDQEGVVHATLSLARIAFFEGRCGRCFEMVERLLDRAGSMRFSDRRSVVQSLAAASYFGPMSVEDALLAHDAALPLVEHSIQATAGLVYGRAALWAMRGDVDAWEAETSHADRMMAELPAPAGYLYQSRGEAPRYLGRLDEAERFFRGALEFWDARGETAFNSTMTALHAAVLCDLGRFDEAAEQTARSRELTAEDDFASLAAWRLADARVASHRGQHGEAMALAEEAIAIMEPTDYLAWQGEGHEVRGMVLEAAGHAGTSRDAFRRALELYETKGVLSKVRQIRERPATA